MAPSEISSKGITTSKMIPKKKREEMPSRCWRFQGQFRTLLNISKSIFFKVKRQTLYLGENMFSKRNKVNLIFRERKKLFSGICLKILEWLHDCFLLKKIVYNRTWFFSSLIWADDHFLYKKRIIFCFYKNAPNRFWNSFRD